MGRNAQLIRQWAILKQIESNRWTTITDLADSHVVSTKTIRRDLAALMEAGFPLYDERYDGKVYWRLNEEYKGLTLANLSLSETAALYFSKKLVVNLAAPPFSSDIASAFKKIESALPERNIQFLDSLDSMISVRADAPKDLDEHKQVIRTLMDAVLLRSQSETEGVPAGSVPADVLSRRDVSIWLRCRVQADPHLRD